MDDPSQMRISDAERHQVAEVLRQAAGDGRIDLDELDERLEATYAAKTYADLIPITADLPRQGSGLAVPTPAPPVPVPPRGGALVVPGPQRSNHVAIMSGFERRGDWVVPAHMNVFALMGGANIDMRHAKFAAPEVVVTVNAIMGGAEIIVGPNVRVVMEGIGIMGGYAGPGSRVPERLTADSPTLRVRGFAFWGGVSVTRKAPRTPPTPPRLGD